LIADDDPQVALFVRRVLEQDGYAVDVVADGAKALESASGASYALLVLDVLMPHKTGVEIVQDLRGRGENVPAVLMSSFSEEELRNGFRGLSQVAFLPKPFGLSELRRAVGKVLGRVPS
jgi:DNA-binding response OmpR family regulator